MRQADRDFAQQRFGRIGDSWDEEVGLSKEELGETVLREGFAFADLIPVPTQARPAQTTLTDGGDLV